MRSYPLLIGGEGVAGQGWTYTLRASAIIAEPARMLAIKRALELGGEVPEHDPAIVVGRCAWGGAAENERAIEAAAAAAREYGAFPAEARHRIGNDLHDAISARREELVEVLVAEGHPRTVARWQLNGILRGTDRPTLKWFFDQVEHELTDNGMRLRVVRRPDGVVALSPPQNAAMTSSVLGLFVLMAGNALVVKAPRSGPLGVNFLYREIVGPVLERHGAPPGTINVVSGDTRALLKQWLRSPLVDDLLFVGGSDVGLRLGQECVAAGKKPVLELAGNDPFVVWRDADLERAAEILCECFYGSSQICMVPKVAIAHPEIAEPFAELLVERAREIRPGYPEDDGALLAPVLKADQFFDSLGEARNHGCEVLTGGARLDVDGEPSDTGIFLEPTVVRVEGLELAHRLRCVREETFFPLLPLVVPSDVPGERLLEAIVDFVDQSPYGLRASLWSGAPDVVERFVAGVRNVGQIRVNSSHIGFSSYISGQGGTGISGGPYGELHYPIFRTSHLQGIVVGDPGQARQEWLEWAAEAAGTAVRG